MKRQNKWLIVPTALAVIFTNATVSMSGVPVIEVARTFESDPIVLNGTSGGTNKTNCGAIAKAPNQVLRITAGQINYMRIKVKAEGAPTLLVDGPGGKFCVLATAGEDLEMSGVWTKGNYSIYVGDRAGNSYPYSLSITQNRN